MSFENPFILLITPPVYDYAAYDLYKKPYGLLRIGRWLKLAGYDIAYINCLDRHDPFSDSLLGKLKPGKNGTGKYYRQILDSQPELKSGFHRNLGRYGIAEESIQNKLDSLRRPDLVLVSGIMTYWYPGVKEVINHVRKQWPKVPVWAGGIYPTLMPDHCLNVCEPDLVLDGPAETKLKQALQKNGFPVPEGSPDPFYLTEDSVWDESAVIRLNEGCPNHCPYCASNCIIPRFKPSDPYQAVEFVESLHKRKGTRHFAFYDDALLMNKKNVFIPFIEEILKRNLDINFYLPNAVHIRFLDAPLLRLMEKAGFCEIRLGLESSDQGFIKNSGGKYGDREMEAFKEAVEESGFDKRKIEGYVLAGLPGQSKEELEVSIRYAASLGFRCRLARYSPVPGTSWWKKSCEMSPYPLADEPLSHNNSLFPLEHSGLRYSDLEDLKRLSDRLYFESLK